MSPPVRCLYSTFHMIYCPVGRIQYGHTSFLPLGLFSTILPLITVLNKSLPGICNIVCVLSTFSFDNQFLLSYSSQHLLIAYSLCTTYPLHTKSIQGLGQGQFSSRIILPYRRVHASQLHTDAHSMKNHVFTILVFSLQFTPMIRNAFCLLNVSFTITIFNFISFSQKSRSLDTRNVYMTRCRTFPIYNHDVQRWPLSS